jgi:hypothetical protein
MQEEKSQWLNFVRMQEPSKVSSTGLQRLA